MGIINKKLDQWQQAGLLSPAQHDAILAFEAKQPNRSSWWLYSLMILGAVIIGLGIISLIAANWADIPDVLKLSVDFLLLLALAGSIYWQYPNRRHDAWFDVLVAGFIVLCLATIGLIAQIYHVGGQWYHALLFWAAITLPIALYARSLFTRFFWVTLFLHGAVWSIVRLTGVQMWQSWLDEIPAVALLAPLLTAVLYIASRQVSYLRTFSSSLFFWFQISAILSLAFADITRSGGELGDYAIRGYLPAYLTAAVLAGGIFWSKQYRLLNKLLLVSALALLLLYYHPDLLFTGLQRYNLFGTADHTTVSFWQADDLRAPLLTLLILFLYAIHSGNIGQQRTFNLVTLLIGLRFLILYFQAMGGLAATGIGLIVSGSLIIGMTWLWYKGRAHLRNWAEELKA